MKTVLKYIITYAILIIFFVISLTIVSIIPSSYIYENVKESAETLYSEGNRKIVNIPYRNCDMQFDNYTDALMINTAYSIDNSNPVESVFLARKNYIKEKTKIIEQDNVGELKSASKYEKHNEVGELVDLVNSDIDESFEYARYWHGYLILLRPMLVLFNINEIRTIIFIIIFILLLIFFYLLQKNTNVIIGLLFTIGLFCVEYFYLGYTLQGISVFLIAIISSIIILMKNKKINNTLLFFIIGMLTNFFDFFTVPIITLGIPLLVVLLLKESEYSFKKSVIEFVKLVLAWIAGYTITWFTKWLLVDIIFKRDLIKIAFEQIGFRSTATKYTILDAIGQNLKYEDKFIIISIILNMIMSVIYLFIKGSKENKYTALEIIPYMLIAIAPYVWYAVIKNHSIEHAFFTYRNQVISIIGLNIIIHKLIMNAKIGERFQIRKNS